MCWQSAKTSDSEPVEESYYAQSLESRMAASHDGSNMTFSDYNNDTTPVLSGPRCYPPAEACLPTNPRFKNYCLRGICCSTLEHTQCVCEPGYGGPRCRSSIVQASSAFPMGSNGMIALIVIIVVIVVLVVAGFAIYKFLKNRPGRGGGQRRASRNGNNADNGDETPLNTTVTPSSEVPVHNTSDADRLKV